MEDMAEPERREDTEDDSWDDSSPDEFSQAGGQSSATLPSPPVEARRIPPPPPFWTNNQQLPFNNSSTDTLVPLCATLFWEDTRQILSEGPCAVPATNYNERLVRRVLEGYERKVSTLLPTDSTQATKRPITIFKLPGYIRETNEAMHKPKLVSIGPYHANKQLGTLQEHKLWCARDYMKSHGVNPEECIRKMAANETKALLCYSEKIYLSSYVFVEMLLLDGCFILDYIRKHHDGVFDTFFNIERNKATIMTDILLTENQIPYFIIHELFNLATGNSGCSSEGCQLRDQILKLLPRQVSWQEPRITCDKIHHILHFYYLCVVPEPPSTGVSTVSITTAAAREPIPYNPGEHRQLVMPSATELAEAGVRFRGNDKPLHLFDVSFKKGVLEIPILLVHDLNTILLANLLAYEQCSYGPKGIMSQFASLLDGLIDTEKDVSLLESSGVLLNMMGSEEETASFFNQHSKWNIVDHTDDHKRLIRNIREFCDSPWPKYRAILVRDYFNNPWAIISVIAAIVLLGLAFVQTYYAVYSTIHN